jgi:hypothetical protein
MTELKTYVCPNCGANATNSLNCEYCGSLLIRFVQKDINISKEDYSIGKYHVDINMIKEFEKNLKRQEEISDRIVTDIYVAENLHKCVSVDRTGFGKWHDGSSIMLGDSNKGLLVVFSFEAYKENGYIVYSPATEKKVKKFKSLKSYPLFINKLCSSRYKTNAFVNDQYVDEYAIDFGADAEGAAILITEILTQVYAIEMGAIFSYYTNIGDASINDSRNSIQNLIAQRALSKQVERKRKQEEKNKEERIIQKNKDTKQTLIWTIILSVAFVILLFLFRSC